MAREFLKGIKSENRLSKVRLIMPNDPVIGGQPSDNADEFTSNTPFLDLACTLMYALAEVGRVDKKDIPKILDALGDSRTAGASQRIVNEVNKLAKNAETAANLANDKANQAKQEAYNADQKAVGAQSTADLNAKNIKKKMDIGAFGYGDRSADIGDLVSRDFDKLPILTQVFTVSGAWVNSPFSNGSTAITGTCETVARAFNAGMVLTVRLHANGKHFERDFIDGIWSGWRTPMSVGDFGLGGKLAITGNIFDKEASGFYRDQSATLYPTQSNINALSVGYSKDRMNGIMFQAASLDAWIYESATRKIAKIITTADLDSLLQVPVDQIFYFDSATPPTGYIARNGQAIDKDKMPKLFAKYGANMPDDRDRVHRMTGALAGAVGTTQEDAIRNIVGQFNTLEELGAGANGVFNIVERPWTANTQRNRGDGINPTFRFDASTVVPTASENRVKSRIILACNKIQ